VNVSGGISIAAKTCADHHAKVPAADTSAAAARADEQMSSPSLPMSANFARDADDDFRCQVVDADPVISSGAMALRISCRHYNSVLSRWRGSGSSCWWQRSASPFKQRGGRVDARPHVFLRVTSDSHGCISAAQHERGATTQATSRSIIADVAQEVFEITVAPIS
jgi:hypothetical protein